MARGIGSLPSNQDTKPAPQPATPAPATLQGPSPVASGLQSPNTYKGAPGGAHVANTLPVFNPYAGAPGGRMNGPSFKPPAPTPPPVDPYQQYQQSVFDNLKNLKPQERALVLSRQNQLSALIGKHNTDAANFNKLVTQSSKGDVNATKAIQARLNQSGYKVSVDGVVGAETVKAYEAFTSKQNTDYGNQIGKMSGWADPTTVRAESNKAIPLDVSNKQRKWIIGRSVNQLATLDAALAHAQAAAKNGDTTAAKKVADIQQAIDSWRVLQQKTNDPVNGFDPTTLNDVFSKVAQSQVHEGEAKVQEILAENTLKNNLLQVVGEGLDPNVNFITHILSTVSEPVFNRFSSAFGAAFEASSHNAGSKGVGESLAAFFGGLLSFVRVPFTDLGIDSVLAPKGSEARKWIEATNTTEERASLVKSGDLLSPGQTILGDSTPQFAAKHGQDYTAGNGDAASSFIRAISPGAGYSHAAVGGKVIKGGDVFSGILDLAFQQAQDPFQYIGGFVQPLENFGEHWGEQALKNATKEDLQSLVDHGLANNTEEAAHFVQQTGRLIGLDSTAVGRAFQGVVHDAVSDFSKVDGKGLAKMLPGLDPEVASQALARRAEVTALEGEQAGANAAARHILQSFTNGAYQPEMGAMRAATSFIGEKLGLYGENGVRGLEVDLGRKVARLSDRTAFIRQFTRARGDIGSVLETNARSFIDKSLDSAVRAGKTSVDKLWETTIGHSLKGVSVGDRFWNLVDAVKEIQNYNLQAAFEGNLRDFFVAPDALKGVPLVSFMDMAYVQDGFEEAVKRMELAVALARGDNFTARVAADSVGDFKANLARGFLISDQAVTDAALTAAQNMGLTLSAPIKGASLKSVRAGIAELPEDIQANLQSRLEGVLAKGKKGLGKLARDVEALKENKGLQGEMSRILEQQSGRDAEAAAGGIGRAGLGDRLAQKASRAALSFTDRAAPRLSIFQQTENISYNRELLAKTATEYMNALPTQLPEHVVSGFLRDIENVATEGEHKAVWHNIVTSAFEANGASPKEARNLVTMLEDAGHFSPKMAKKPIFGTLPDGTRIENVQLLSQRFEDVALPAPAKMAALMRQAVLDGAVDGNTAQRIGARIGTVVHGVGDIGFTYANGAAKFEIRMPFKKAFEIWKTLVVTNMGMPVVGAAAGFIYGDGGTSITDRLKGAGVGFGVGSVGMLRFVVRTAGIDDQLRRFFGDSALPDFMYPGLSSMRKSRLDAIEGDVYRRTLSGDTIRVGNFGTDHFSNDYLIHVDPEWDIIPDTHPRFVDSYGRVVNHQFNPESDPVVATILHEKAGHFDGQTMQVTRIVNVNDRQVSPAMAAAGIKAADTSTDVVAGKVGEATPENLALFKELGFGGEMAAPGEDPYAALKAAAGDASASEHVNPQQLLPTNERLLEDFPDHNTAILYRGEPAYAEGAARGGHWIPEDYGPDGGQAYARNLAGEDGKVYRVEVPVDERGVPVVGERARAGEVGWMLDGENAKWADSADQMAPNGYTTEAMGKAAGFTHQTITLTVPLSPREIADRDIAAFIETEQGQIWLKRYREIGITGSDKRVAKKAVERIRTMTDRYFTPELADLRVGGGLGNIPSEIDRDTLLRAAKDGTLASEVHGQQIWKMPHNSRELFRTAKAIPGDIRKGVMSTPSNVLNRGPWQTKMFERQYDRLVAQGVERPVAQRLADSYASRTVRGTLHYYSDLSRAAAALDPFMPFTHAREDILRVWSRFIVEHPVRILAVGRQAALAFNNGQENGTFTQNPFTGQWEVTIPGLGAVASKIFGLGAEMGFSTNILDLIFSGASGYGPAGGLADSFLPKPGGPFWSLFTQELAKHEPQLFQGDNAIQHWLWGYGPNGDLLRADTSRLWMAFSGETPPWEVGNQDHWTNQLNRWRVEMYQELIYRHLQDNPNDTNWEPTDQQVDDTTRNFFLAWSFYSSAAPGASHVTIAGPSAYFQAKNAFTLGGIMPWDPKAFLAKYPQFEPFMTGPTSEYTGPDDLASLRGYSVGGNTGLLHYDPASDQWVPDTAAGKQHVKDALDTTKIGLKTYKTLGQFKADFEKYKRTKDYFTALENANHIPAGVDRERAIINVNKTYPDIVATQTRNRNLKEDIYTVLFKYPKGQMQADALNRIKTQYKLSNADMQYWLKQAKNPTYLPNPWADARQGIEVDAAVRETLGAKITDLGSVQAYVSTLSPAEQLRYWQYQKDTVGYSMGLDDPNAVLNRWSFYKNQESQVGLIYPWLFRATNAWVNPWDAAMNNAQNLNYENMTKAYDAIDRLNLAIDYAKKYNNWTQWKSLRAQRDSYYNMIDAMRNKWYQNTPNLHKYYEDMHLAAVELGAGNMTAAKSFLAQAAVDKGSGGMFLIPDEQRFLNMPVPVQQAYMQSLIQDLNLPPQDAKADPSLRNYLKDVGGLKKSYWEWLTPLQQKILEGSFPQYVDKWKSDSNYYLHGDGAVKLGYKVPPELQRAYDILDKYDKRAGLAEPSAYKAYLALPNSFAARQQFLNAHPDVKAYVDRGPFKNMPKHLRDQVVAALQKFGKIQGGGYGGSSSGGHSSGVKDRGFGRYGNLSVSWALSTLHQWSQRGNLQKPAAYDQWVNMPSGQAKEDFLNSHPDVQNWVKLGPMSSMPEMYKEVVRAILVQYGYWTQKDDPLGNTISQFFSTPGYAREDFLTKHPELSAYWALSRTPEEQQMFDLQNQYFAISDVGAKQAFLSSHPELQQHFMDQRTKRYEQFLNQVAVYMGANPSMFQEYLNRQQDVLAELLRKFATPALLREVAPEVMDQTGGETGRHRGARARAAA